MFGNITVAAESVNVSEFNVSAYLNLKKVNQVHDCTRLRLKPISIYVYWLWFLYYQLIAGQSYFLIELNSLTGLIF